MSTYANCLGVYLRYPYCPYQPLHRLLLCRRLTTYTSMNTRLLPAVPARNVMGCRGLLREMSWDLDEPRLDAVYHPSHCCVRRGFKTQPMLGVPASTPGLLTRMIDSVCRPRVQVGRSVREPGDSTARGGGSGAVQVFKGPMGWAFPHGHRL